MPGKQEFNVPTAPTQFSDHLQREREVRSWTHQCSHVHSGQQQQQHATLTLCYKSNHATQAEEFCVHQWDVLTL